MPVKHTLVLIPGDGIGPEVTEAVTRILSAAGADIDWVECQAGQAALDRGADRVLPDQTLAAVIEHGVALKGPCSTPIAGGFPSVNVALRRRLNLYGNVISDLCAGMVGGLGVTPGANFGDGRAIFEAVHGTAPDIMGKNLANPLALLMSAVMMLNYLAANRGDGSCGEIATRLRAAYNACLIAGEKTHDLGGSMSCTGFTDAVIARL